MCAQGKETPWSGGCLLIGPQEDKGTSDLEEVAQLGAVPKCIAIRDDGSDISTHTRPGVRTPYICPHA
jgi:hypothetical protein